MAAQKPTLLTIPPEIRLQIYEYVLEDDTCLRYFVRHIIGKRFFVSEIDTAQAAGNQQIKQKHTALSRTSRTINEESKALRRDLMLSFTGRIDVCKNSTWGEISVAEDGRMGTGIDNRAFFLDHSAVRAASMLGVRIAFKGIARGTVAFRHITARRGKEVLVETASENGVILTNDFGGDWTMKDDISSYDAGSMVRNAVRRNGWQV